MKRRTILTTLTSLPLGHLSGLERGHDLTNPYENVDWGTWRPLHSMSHQHQGMTDASRDGFLEMGYGHWAFSNYYPSRPTYPLPHAYTAKHPEVVAAPNAEQHSFTDAGLHCNSLGSLLDTGYGSEVGGKARGTSPLEHVFDELNVYNNERPWLGVYRLDIRLASSEAKAIAMLTVAGGIECSLRDGFAVKGEVKERALSPGDHTLYFRVTEPPLKTKLVFDEGIVTVTQFRLMQGTNRPWRDVFRAALDGEVVDGKRAGGLLYPDGGGITLNHPTGKLADYLPMLDFDPRVLGIEVWNQLTSGFGSSRGFYDQTPGPHFHFYQLWDQILAAGRRCWGFFVKDHNTLGRGRNILLVPQHAGSTPEQREAAALRSYRNGSFFGSVAAMAVNEKAEVVAPFDRSDFRFTRIIVKRSSDGRAESIQVTVAGNDPNRRPNVQIRFVTEAGISKIVNGPQAEYQLNREGNGSISVKFIRIEAFAYPSTHQRGQPLTAEMMSKMNVHDISLLHDHKASGQQAFSSNRGELRVPIPIVDMIFSQPLQRV